jgi:glycerate kinase
MRILICPDKFKGSLSAKQVCEALETGIHQGNTLYEIIQLPLADGGEGTLEVLQVVLGGEMVKHSVLDPLFRPILADYLWIESDKKAFIEMFRASGLALLAAHEQNALKTSSFGTGQLILHALELGAKEIILTIGGSATNDAGIGMAAALGFQFLDVNANALRPIGENLVHINHISPSKSFNKFKNVVFKVATDVDNPLFGLEGAAYVFAAQKGANADAISYLDKGLINIAQFFDQGQNISQQTGAGASGGLGAGAMYFLQAEKISGSTMVLDAVNFEHELAKSDFVITGEGKIDEQTWYGKLVAEVLKRALKANKKCMLVCGMLDHSEQIPNEFKHLPILSIASRAKNPADSMLNAKKYLEEIGRDVRCKMYDVRCKM